MQVRFFTNASLEIIASDVRILCDPWFVPGAFDGSWYHDHPLRTEPEDLISYTHLYVSHIHPDHCDLRTLRRLPNKSVPVIILNVPQKFLKRALQRAGFNQIVEVDDGQSVALSRETRLTMYRAFTASSLIEQMEIPNIIDSAIVVENRGLTLFNANDNTPTPEACEELRARFGPIDCALVPFSGVGPYPSCYLNLTDVEKESAAESKMQGFLTRMVENCLALEPKRVFPIAGAMLLGGRQFHKNRYIGVPPIERAVEQLVTQNVDAFKLEEGDVYDVGSGTIEQASYEPLESSSSYEARISRDRYWWEDAFRIPALQQSELLPVMATARARMWEYQRRFGFDHDSWVIVEVPDFADDDRYFAFPMDSDRDVQSMTENDFKTLSSSVAYLRAVVQYDYLVAILTRHCHWNNAYHGCHVDWYRSPDVYRPEIQTLMSFLHL